MHAAGCETWVLPVAGIPTCACACVDGVCADAAAAAARGGCGSDVALTEYALLRLPLMRLPLLRLRLPCDELRLRLRNSVVLSMPEHRHA